MDVTNYDDVKMFTENKIDIVVHTAVQGGKRGHYEKIDDLMNNIAMFQNLAKFRDQFKFMFNFGSGAEFDRRFNINQKIEIDIWNQNPVDMYGLAKESDNSKKYTSWIRTSLISDCLAVLGYMRNHRDCSVLALMDFQKESMRLLHKTSTWITFMHRM